MARAEKKTRVRWSEDEDKKLTDYMKNHGGSGRKVIWTQVSKGSGLQRNGKSCRLRWTYFLRPKINKGPLSKDEKKKIINLQANHGNKWTYIAGKLEGRTDTQVKNFWKHYSKKKLRQTEAPVLVAQAPLLGQSFSTADISWDEVLMDGLLSIPTEPVSALPESSMVNYGQLENFLMYDETDCRLDLDLDLDFDLDLDSFMEKFPPIPTAPVSASPMSSMANEEQTQITSTYPW